MKAFEAMGRVAKPDLIAVLSAAYRVENTDADWLAGLAEACRPLLDQGLGICTFEFYYRPGLRPRMLQWQTLGMSDELAQIYPVVFANMDADIQTLPFARGPCIAGSQMMGARQEFLENPLMQRFAHRFGMYDSLWITAAEPSGWGCGMHAGRPRIQWASRAVVEQWSRLAAHLSAGARLRRRIARKDNEETPRVPEAEAVLSPDGQVRHAEGRAKEAVARDRLRRAVIDLETLRTTQSERSDGAFLRGWKGLVDGRWSLLDRFESDGKRYVVALENEPEPPPHRELTLRERQVVAYAALGHENKVIAYDLGIAHSTVRVLMARAAFKWNAASREGLVAAYLASCADPSGPMLPSLGLTTKHQHATSTNERES